jgi:hypothetical protein
MVGADFLIPDRTALPLEGLLELNDAGFCSSDPSVRGLSRAVEKDAGLGGFEEIRFDFFSDLDRRLASTIVSLSSLFASKSRPDGANKVRMSGR